MHFFRHFLSAVGVIIFALIGYGMLIHRQLHGDGGDMGWILFAALVYALARAKTEQTPTPRAVSPSASMMVVLVIGIGGILLANRTPSGLYGGTYSSGSQEYANDGALLEGFIANHDYLLQHGFQPAALPTDEPFAGWAGLHSPGMQTIYYAQGKDTPNPLKMSIAIHPQGHMLIVGYDTESHSRREADALEVKGQAILADMKASLTAPRNANGWNTNGVGF